MSAYSISLGKDIINPKIQANINHKHGLEDITPQILNSVFNAMCQYANTSQMFVTWNLPNIKKSTNMLIKGYLHPQNYLQLLHQIKPRIDTSTITPSQSVPNFTNVSQVVFTHLIPIPATSFHISSDIVLSGPLIFLYTEVTTGQLYDRLSRAISLISTENFTYAAPFFAKVTETTFVVGLYVDSNDIVSMSGYVGSKMIFDSDMVDAFNARWSYIAPSLNICKFFLANEPCPWRAACPYPH